MTRVCVTRLKHCYLCVTVHPILRVYLCAFAVMHIYSVSADEWKKRANKTNEKKTQQSKRTKSNSRSSSSGSNSFRRSSDGVILKYTRNEKKVKWISVMLQNVTTTNTTISMWIFSFKSNAIEYFVHQHNLPLIVLLYEPFAIAKEPDNSIIWYAFDLLFYFFSLWKYWKCFNLIELLKHSN